MKHYVTAPAIIYADEVLVQSENTKKMYIKKLAEFAGEETEEVWDKKLKVTNLYDNEELPENTAAEDTKAGGKKADNNIINNKKVFVYCIGENELAKNKEKAVTEMRERLETFSESSSGIKVKICMYPPAINVWESVDSNITQSLLNLIKEYTNQEWCEMCDINTVEWEDIARESSAYYGSPSPLVHMFTMKNKPVMISR